MNFNATLIGQSIAFAVFVWFTMKFVWPLLLGQMREREARIADGLAAAEKGRATLAAAEAKRVELVEAGRRQAADIVAQGQRRHDELLEEAKRGAEQERERILAAAETEVEQQQTRAREQLRTEVAALALAGAERILEREVDRKAHDRILERLGEEL